MRKRKYNVNDNYFLKPNIENSYWAGFLSADGYIPKSRKLICIDLSSKDLEHLKLFKNTLNYDGGIYTRFRTRGDKQHSASRLRVSSEDIVNQLSSNFNIYDNKAKCQEPPNLKQEESLAFIKGLIDGDGCIRRRQDRNNVLSFELLGSKKMLEWVIYWFNTIEPIKFTIRLKDNIFNIRSESKAIERILIYLKQLNTPYLSRKWDKI